MENNIKKVLDAEAKADKVLADAKSKAEKIVEDAKKEVLDIESKTDEEIIKLRNKSLKGTESEISIERERLISDAKLLQKAQERQAEKNRKKAADFVVSLLKENA